MKKYIVLLVLSLASLMPVMAQPNGRGRQRPFNPEEFKARMETYIREKACLSPCEAEKIMPIFFEMKTKQMEINHSIMKLKHEAVQGDAGNGKNYCEIVSQITSLNVELAKLEQTYYAKMCKAVSSKKAFDVMIADDRFHREMLRNARNGRLRENAPR